MNAASDDARKLVRDTDDLKRKMRLYHQRMTSIIENQLASIQSDDWAEIFRPTQDYAINPEEKLQSIIEEHLENAETTLAKTQAIKPLTDEDIAQANELLGYSYETSGLVVHGFARGRQLGYPTANLVIKDYVHLPAVGVYTCDVIFAGERHRGFASIGYNDTFNGTEKTVEVHIFDFNGDIYGEKLTVLWLDKIRDMIKFDGIDQLIKQMKEDEQIARDFKA